jgi:ribosomal-protein-alanine N-acetyltransferase
MQINQSMILSEGDRIVLMQQEDLAVVHQLECASQSDPWSLRHFADELDSRVATVDLYWCREQLAGFLCTWLIAGELQIQNLATLPQMRRRGIAAKLLAHAIERSQEQGLTSVCLEVRVTNKPAITLYERFGFTIDGTRPSYYPDGEDALLMTYQL